MRKNKAVDSAKRKSGGGRKPSKPGYDANRLLQKQIDSAVALYVNENITVLMTIRPFKG